MVANIRHVGIVVADLKKSLFFYRTLLGFKIVKEMEEAGDYINTMLSLSNVKVTTVKMSSSKGQMIELLKYNSHPTEQKLRKVFEIGISHLAITVDDLDAEYEKLKRRGVNFNSSPQFSPDGHVKLLFVKHPKGR